MMIQQFETLMIDSWSNSSFPFSTSISSQERINTGSQACIAGGTSKEEEEKQAVSEEE